MVDPRSQHLTHTSPRTRRGNGRVIYINGRAYKPEASPAGLVLHSAAHPAVAASSGEPGVGERPRGFHVSLVTTGRWA